MTGARILIVEDESIIALGIQQSLKYAGYDVCALASTGENALNLIANNQPDLVLMDIMLNGALDGIDTAERVRALFNLPVVFLTALNDQSTLKRAKTTEPFGYVIKPCDDQELITAIEIALARHRAETAIRCALERERELREVKSRFISILSHEFRNPLSTILMTQELLRECHHSISDEKFEIYCDRIADSVNDMNQLIQEVLTIGETESRDFEFRPAPIDIIPFCQLLLEDLREKSKFHKLTIDANELTFQDLPLLDVKLLHHILSNLVTNAVKYSPAGGNVTLKLFNDAETIFFAVADEGIGIPTDALERLFEAFHRGSNVGSIPGSGLGLAIVKQCVDLHSGTIDVFSQLGEGTTFTVKLPLKHH